MSAYFVGSGVELEVIAKILEIDSVLACFAQLVEFLDSFHL
jgi:hypothetical protein